MHYCSTCQRRYDTRVSIRLFASAITLSVGIIIIMPRLSAHAQRYCKGNYPNRGTRVVLPLSTCFYNLTLTSKVVFLRKLFATKMHYLLFRLPLKLKSWTIIILKFIHNKFQILTRGTSIPNRSLEVHILRQPFYIDDVTVGGLMEVPIVELLVPALK